MSDTNIFKNRELSWIQFNNRVLEQGYDEFRCIAEKLKFLSITASNLDEFFMVRVGGLTDMINANYTEKDISGLTPKQQLEYIHKDVHKFYHKQYDLYNNILHALNQNGNYVIKSYKDLSEQQKKYVDKIFKKDIYPLLTPLAVDSSRPFPIINSNTVNIGAILSNHEGSKLRGKLKKKDFEFSTIQIPTSLPRVIKIPNDGDSRTFILIEEVIKRNIKYLYKNYDVKYTCCYRITRNADLNFHEEDAADLLKEIKKQLKYRKWGEVVRIEVEEKIDSRLLKILKRNLRVKHNCIYCCKGPVGLSFCMEFVSKKLIYNKHTILYPQEFEPTLGKEFSKSNSMFELISDHDILLWHPYDSYDPVMRFIDEAANDDKVLAIKQTLYRVSEDSPIVKSLMKAAENGKEVTIVVEVKARFDEENNIDWAEKLEKAGCHVIYGLAGLKVHSKICLVIRKEKDDLKRYVHLATGNYNDKTAKQYVDYSYFTCKEEYGEDGTTFFNMLSGYSEPKTWKVFYVSPINLRKKINDLIDIEIACTKKENIGSLMFTVNSLCDKKIIEKLYEASKQGVKIRLYVRGICCMKPINNNIEILSVVGTFLEHSRVYRSLNSEQVYLSSADLMERNLNKRVELLFPVPGDLLDRVEMSHLTEYDKHQKEFILQSDGEYKDCSI